MNQILIDAADAEEGTSAPLSWEFMYSVQKTFSLGALGGVKMVDWPPFFEGLTTSASLRCDGELSVIGFSVTKALTSSEKGLQRRPFSLKVTLGRGCPRDSPRTTFRSVKSHEDSQSGRNTCIFRTPVTEVPKWY